MERQVKGWADRYEKAKTKDIEIMDELVKWLEEKLPESPSPAILHNDYRLDNIMLDPVDPGKLVAVFDWDMGTIGDPLADMGCLLSFWIEQGEGMGFGSSGGPACEAPSECRRLLQNRSTTMLGGWSLPPRWP